MAPRRVVTGIDDGGTARVVHDGPAPHVRTASMAPGFETVHLWSADDVPTTPGDGTDPTGGDGPLFPEPPGSRFIVNVFPPGFGAGSGELFLHTTATVDYGVVISGELTLVLGSGEEVTLRAGDTVVQNGTEHAWRNTSAEPAVAAFVILGARWENGR